MSYYCSTILTAIVILTILSAIPFLAWAQIGTTTADGSRMRFMKTTATENIYENQLGYRLQYPLNWTLTEYPTSVFASALANGGNALDIALCPKANISLVEEEEEEDDSLDCITSIGDKVWIWIYMPVDDDIPSLAVAVEEHDDTKKPFIVQGANSTGVLDEFINARLALAEVYEQTNLSIINQTSIMVNVTDTSALNNSAAATTEKTLKQQLPAKIVEYILTEPETSGESINEFRRVVLFVVDYEENRAFEVEYTPMSAIVPGYPEEVGKIFKSFEVIRNNNNNTASLQNNNMQAEISNSFIEHQ